LAVGEVRRRFVGLSALSALPIGFLLPTWVLLQQDRGLTLAEVGVVLATQAIVVVVLELPTGGLADALGRRPVLVAAAVLDVAALVVVAVAGSLPAMAVAAGLQGVHKALESGPLEAWFVDATRAADPAAELGPGLARASTALCAAVAGGALGAAGLVAWAPLDGVAPLALPVGAAVVARVAHAAALARWLVEPPAGAGAGHAAAAGTGAGADADARRGGGGPTAGVRSVLDGVRRTPAVVRSTLGLLRGSRALAALVLVEVSWGAGLAAVEVFTGPRLVELVGGPAQGASVYGIAVAVGWTASALGSGATGALVRRLGGGPARAGAVLRLAQAAGALALATVAGPGGLVVGYVGFYLVHGASNVVHYGMVHELVDASRRTTVLSVHSLAARAAAAVAVVLLGRLAAATGPGAALAVAAALLVLAAPLYLVAGRPGPAPADGCPDSDGAGRSMPRAAAR
jgi:MFS family permease